MWFKCIKCKESRFVVSKRICKGYRVLILNLIKEVRSVSLGLFIKDNNNTRMVSLILSFPTRVPLSRLAFKHKKRLITHNSVSKYCNLKGTLLLVITAFPFLKLDCFVPLFSICTALEVFK
jgi:hypothetical protein